MPELSVGRYAGEFVVSEGNGSISRESITVLSGQNLVAAAVLGKITASGKYRGSIRPRLMALRRLLGSSTTPSTPRPRMPRV
jgi:Bacteriophage lambda head decoration protein D